MNQSGETCEQQAVPTNQIPQDTERSGKYLCLRCGWRWSPRSGCPDPPSACSHCRTSYWNVPPERARANRPDDPRWQAERDAKAARRRSRQLTRLKELALELGHNTGLVPETEPEELPLRGDELAKILLADAAKILARDPRLDPQVAYYSLSYNLRVVLHFDKAVRENPLPPGPPNSGH
jgi:hypothetical protein